MIDHRKLQRTLFRMQLDAKFATSVLDGDPQAIASTGLTERERALLERADPVAIAADHHGRRRLQLLGNVAAEFMLCVALGADGKGGERFLQGFASSPFFHAAIAHATSLPLAFADYAESVAATSAEPAFIALVTLEATMARARRMPVSEPAVEAGSVVLNPAVRLVALRAGAFDYAAHLRAAVDRGMPLPRAPSLPSVTETVLVAAAAAATGRLREVRVEVLSEPVAQVLMRAQRPLSRSAREALAREYQAEPADLERLIQGFVNEGILRKG